MPLQAMWVHGSSVAMESPGGGGGLGERHSPGHQMDQVAGQPWTDIVGARSIGGTHFVGQAGQTNTFLFSIPSPVFRGGGAGTGRAALIQAYVLFSTTNRAVVTSITLADGPNIFQDVHGDFIGIIPQNPPISGDFSGTGVINTAELGHLLPRVTFALPQPRPVLFGVGIAVSVLFGDEAGQGGDITFTAAGADFEVTP